MVQLKKDAKTFVQTKLRSKLPESLTPEQEKEIIEWVIDQLGGGTITKQEAHDALVAFLDKHGFDQPSAEEWKMLEDMFDAADLNKDGEIDLKEFAFACAGPPPEEMVQLKKSAKKFVQTKLRAKLPEELTEEQEMEIIEWVIAELGGGTITKQEAHDALVAFLDKHGYPQPSAEEWKMLEDMFDAADQNGDGEIDLKEFAMACHGPPSQEMVQIKKHGLKFIQTKMKSMTKSPAITEEQALELLEWVLDELSGGTITKQEAHDALSGFLKKHGYPQPTPEEWQMLEAMFDEVDKNGDGEIDLKEFVGAMMGIEF